MKGNNYNITGDTKVKITKQRLKEIIKEELENSQNEGFFSRVGAKLGKENKITKSALKDIIAEELAKAISK